MKKIIAKILVYGFMSLTILLWDCWSLFTILLYFLTAILIEMLFYFIYKLRK